MALAVHKAKNQMGGAFGLISLCGEHSGPDSLDDSGRMVGVSVIFAGFAS